MEPLGGPSPPWPSSSLAERARGWLTWFGTGRLVAASVATVAVCVGGWWLLHAPVPPTEASLPRATAPPEPSLAVELAPDVAGGGPPDGGPVVVHVTGAVAAPGVYELATGARVRDAVVAAGGPVADADADALNLAALVADGSRIYVPMIGEEVAAPLVVGADPAGSASGSGSGAGPVDVNRAGIAELDTLPGIGPSIAAAIVTERERNGPFLGVDDLQRVPGIGPARIEALRDLVTT